MKNRILSVLAALAFVFTLAIHASATGEMPPLHEKGSLSLAMHYDGKPLEDGKVNILQVGSVEENAEGNYDFRIFAPLGRETITQQELYDPEVAGQLLAKAKVTHSQNVISKAIVSGNAVFEDLNTGLYLVWQEEADASAGLSPFQPFLISVPRMLDGAYCLDVTAAPKVPLLPEPTEPPPTTEPEPPTPSLPVTGQLNWPIPVLTVAGVLLIMIGLILCVVSRKRNGYEE